MRELAVQAANGTNSDDDRTNLDAEYQELKAEIDRLGTSTKFNSQAVFGSTTYTFQVGANADDTIDVAAVAAPDTDDLGAITTQSAASDELEAIDDMLDAINTDRATLGAVQNRFESVISSLQVAAENQAAAKSRIMDADFAVETANLTRGQILQ